MSILSDHEIERLIKEGLLEIKPFNSEIIRENGVDLRIGWEIARLKETSKVFEPGKSRVEEFYSFERGDSFIIYPKERVLIHTVEYVKLPRNIAGFINLRSSLARLGLTLPPCIHSETLIIGGEGLVEKAYKQNHNVIGVNISTGEAAPTKALKYEAYSGVMVKVETIHSNCLVTPNHRFLAFKNNALIEVPAMNLEKGDRVAIPLRIKLNSNIMNLISAKLAKLIRKCGSISKNGVLIDSNSDFEAKKLQLLFLTIGVYPKIIGNKLFISGVENLVNLKRRFPKSIVDGLFNPEPEKLDFVPLTMNVENELNRRGLIEKFSDGLMRRDLRRVLKILPSIAREDLIKASKFRWDVVSRVELKWSYCKVIDFEVPMLSHYLAGPYVTHNTVIDAGFEGQLTIELIGGAFPIKLRAGERIIHVVFSKLSSPVIKKYSGKYLGQRGIRLPSFKTY